MRVGARGANPSLLALLTPAHQPSPTHHLHLPTTFTCLPSPARAARHKQSLDDRNVFGPLVNELRALQVTCAPLDSHLTSTHPSTLTYPDLPTLAPR